MSNDDGFEDCMTSARSAVEAISSFNERAQPGPRWVDVQVHAALSDLRSALVILAARADPSRVARAVAGGMGGKPGLPSVEPETTSTFGCDVGRTELGEAIERAGFEARFDIAGHVRLACAVERERARIVEAIRERERVERADPWAKDYEAGIAMGLAMAAAFVETGKWWREKPGLLSRLRTAGRSRCWRGARGLCGRGTSARCSGPTTAARATARARTPGGKGPEEARAGGHGRVGVRVALVVRLARDGRGPRCGIPRGMNLEECRAAIHIAVGVSKNIDDAVAALRQEEARLEAGLALTPRELVEALRAHARRRVEMGRRVEFVRQDQWVMASPYDGAWRFNTARYEQKASREHVLDWVAEATAFAANVD